MCRSGRSVDRRWRSWRETSARVPVSAMAHCAVLKPAWLRSNDSRGASCGMRSMVAGSVWAMASTSSASLSANELALCCASTSVMRVAAAVMSGATSTGAPSLLRIAVKAAMRSAIGVASLLAEVITSGSGGTLRPGWLRKVPRICSRALLICSVPCRCRGRSASRGAVVRASNARRPSVALGDARVACVGLVVPWQRRSGSAWGRA